MNDLWMLVFAVGAAQGAFLCVALLLRRSKNQLSTRLLAAMVGAATAMIVAGALIESSPEPFERLLSFLSINTELAFGPLLMLFARSLVEPTRRLVRRDALHFLPLVGGMLLWASAWFLLGDAARRVEFLRSPIVPIYMVFKAGWYFSYAAIAVNLLRCDSRVSLIHPVGRRPVELTWLRRAILVLSAMAGTIYLSDFASRFGWLKGFESDPYGSLVLTVMIYLASLMVLQRPWVLSLRVRPTATDWADQVSRLKSHLETERPWLRPDLSLRDLAGGLKTTEHRLSSVIRDGLDTSFYPLLNRYRLAEFERLARDPSLQHKTVLELAYEAGFNSKASFYRVFRESHGTTPTAFRDAI